MAARRHELQLAAWAAVLACVLAAAAVGAATGRSTMFVGVAGAGAAAAAVALALQAQPAWPLSLGIAAAVFSGNSAYMGLPVSPDRVLILAGLGSFVVRRWMQQDRGERPAPLRVEGVHWLLFVAGLWAIGSAWAADTLTESASLFGLLDRFGLVPFLMFLLAPLVFATERERRILLGVLVGLGAYLGFTAICEGIGLDALVWPKYILDESVGIHSDRARGPFVEAEANGLALFGCAIAATMGVATWRERPRIRLACGLVAMLCVVGTLFTLSRGVWLAAGLATAIAILIVPGLWRKMVPALLVVAMVMAASVSVIPGLQDSLDRRGGDDTTVWSRSNTNNAALRMIAERPLEGFGWQRFQRSSAPYFVQAATYPMNGIGDGAHNVFLSNASELGLPGAFLWFAGFTLAIGGALVRRAPPELRLWRAGLLTYLIAWLVIANVTPLAFAFPTLLLWTWAGVVWSGRHRQTESRTVPA